MTSNKESEEEVRSKYTGGYDRIKVVNASAEEKGIVRDIIPELMGAAVLSEGLDNVELFVRMEEGLNAFLEKARGLAASIPSEISEFLKEGKDLKPVLESRRREIESAKLASSRSLTEETRELRAFLRAEAQEEFTKTLILLEAASELINIVGDVDPEEFSDDEMETFRDVLDAAAEMDPELVTRKMEDLDLEGASLEVLRPFVRIGHVASMIAGSGRA